MLMVKNESSILSSPGTMQQHHLRLVCFYEHAFILSRQSFEDCMSLLKLLFYRWLFAAGLVRVQSFFSPFWRGGPQWL